VSDNRLVTGPAADPHPRSQTDPGRIDPPARNSAGHSLSVTGVRPNIRGKTMINPRRVTVRGVHRVARIAQRDALWRAVLTHNGVGCYDSAQCLKSAGGLVTLRVPNPPNRPSGISRLRAIMIIAMQAIACAAFLAAPSRPGKSIRSILSVQPRPP